MSLLDDFITISNAYDESIQSAVTFYNELTVTVNEIDPASDSAQTDLNLQEAVKNQAITQYEENLAALLTQRKAAVDAILAYTGPDRDSILADATARGLISDQNLAALQAMGPAMNEAFTNKQVAINEVTAVTKEPIVTPEIGIPPGVRTHPTYTAPTNSPAPKVKKQHPTLTNFIANLKGRGIPSAAHYYVQIIGIQSREVWMMCEQAMLPGLNIMTAEVRTYGEIRESPYGITYQPVNLTFLLDNTMDGKRLFEDWSNKIFNRNTRTAGYYDNYVGTVKIYQTDADGNIIYAVELREAFPKTIQDVQLGYENKELLKLNVAMAFKYWVEVDHLGNEISTVPVNKQTYDGTERLKNDLLRKGIKIPNEMKVSKIDNYDVADALIKAGESLTAQAGVASSLVGSAAVQSGQPGLANAFSGLTNTIGQFGAGMVNLGANLTNVMTPISQLGQASAAISGSLGSINSILSALGLGSPLSKTMGEFTKLGGQFGQLAGLKGLPQLLGNAGSSFAGLAGVFGGLSSAVNTIPNSTKALGTSVGNLGSVLSTQSTQINNAASKM